ncbi:TIGR03619 family F420-dependent LLM class oxidoreductase [Novosphingobium sp. G106]|uniref:TIGR03619 family F420-dependent LLM class oxidoreductase n=1 Tax=Novosphingobium sp. G106 TaxID=2849500 RepID=UPI001C2D5AC9|nr:TIGR03619 family F420-dependent LLM class oxidoreductase [Novosphingobium sp. G106]MBV1689012.1 TIGR03619 family F420-dependent LLM class oxidoreductase [Novosphingobium sp. G106]
MKFTVAIPLGDITPGEFQTPDAVRTMSVALETAGIDACYVTDHPAPDAKWLHANGHDALDPFSAFAFVAAATTRLRMHTNIVVMAYRNPFLTAKSAATVQLLSGGRLILGVGAGYQKAEFEALGVDFHKRGKLFDEALKVIRQAWAGGPVEYQGTNFHAAGNEPRPAPNPSPPIWIGGGSDKAVERAARWGDGWSPFYAAPTMSQLNRDTGIHTVDQLGEKIAMLQGLRQQIGKTGRFDVAIGPKARLNYGHPGGADRFLEELRGLADVGVTWAMVEPPHPSRQAYIENVQWFGEEVVARLR